MRGGPGVEGDNIGDEDIGAFRQSALSVRESVRDFDAGDYVAAEECLRWGRIAALDDDDVAALLRARVYDRGWDSLEILTFVEQLHERGANDAVLEGIRASVRDANGPRSTKRSRRTRAEMAAIRKALVRVVRENQPVTVRQAFYAMVRDGLIAKTETEYKKTVCRLLGELRESGDIPFSWISDNCRWMRKPRTYDSLADALESTRRTYRRALWNDQDVYVEIWIEKDALAGVISDITAEWDVPLMVVRGWASKTYLHSAAETIAAVGKPTFIYYFGDHDPAGVAIPRKIEAEIRRYAPGAEVHFARLGVNEDQIALLNLPTRPTKTTDSRAGSFKGESVDLDALPAEEFRRLVSHAITQHIDPDVLERTRQIEEVERESLDALVLRGAA
jgi:hypothetical protein